MRWSGTTALARCHNSFSSSSRLHTVSVALIHNGGLNGNPVCWGWALVGIVEARQATSREIPEIQSSRETSIGATDNENSKGAGNCQHTVVGRHLEGKTRQGGRKVRKGGERQKGPRNVKIMAVQSIIYCAMNKARQRSRGKMSGSATSQPEYSRSF